MNKIISNIIFVFICATGSLLFISFLSLAICHILYSDSYFPIDFEKWFWINWIFLIFIMSLNLFRNYLGVKRHESKN